MKRKLLAVALMAVVALTGCANSDLSSEESAAVYPLTLTDTYGHEVTIEEEPQTIVTVSPALTEIVYALDAQDKLAGRSDYDDYPEAVFDIQAVGPIDMPDVELIVSLNPDVVLASSIFSEEAYNAITEAGIPVVIINDESSLSAMPAYVSTVADVIGKHDEGAAMAEDLTNQLETIAQDGTGVTVYYCMGYGEYGDYTAGGDTFINDIIETAGCVNIASDVEGWMYSTEALLANDPDIILVPSWGADYFLETEPYNNLTGTVVAIDANLFERVGPRNIEAIQVIIDAAAELNSVDAAA